MLDATKLIPEEDLPIKPVGRLVLDRRVDNFFAETEQVAFCTQNVVPGSTSRTTRCSRGGTSRTSTPRSSGWAGRTSRTSRSTRRSARCTLPAGRPHGHAQPQVGRVNYEPNSWSADPGPRESPETGFTSYPAREDGPKVRERSETFSDHYSQARQFYVSQAEVEKTHIADALVFELSKVQTPAIRSRMVGHLLNIDAGLAKSVASGLRLPDMPKAAVAAKPTKHDLKPSPKLSIVMNAPKTFASRKVGALVTDGVDATLLKALGDALKAEGAMLKLIAPHIGGVVDSDGVLHPADEKVDGGPSVLFDAVAILPSKEGASMLATMPPARDFVADAVAHKKFLGFVEPAMFLFTQVGIAGKLDDGFVLLKTAKDCDAFVARCRALRFWDRKD